MNKWVVLAAGAAAALGAFGLFFLVRVPRVSVPYTESAAAPVNPGRGLYVQFDTGRTAKLPALRESGITLALLAYDLRDFRDREISAEKLAELTAALDLAEENGIRVIFRAAYYFGERENYRDPSGLALIKKHIAQIAPVLNASGAVLCVQAGFIGPWGEWHSSGLLTGDDKKDAGLRTAVLACLISALDGDIKINVRRPRFVREASAAGLDISRLGFHNDALLSTESDMGTYDDAGYTRQAELDWVGKNLRRGVNGGEMPSLSQLSRAGNAAAEFTKIGLTYLNSRYNTEVLEAWKQESINGRSAYEYITSRLGYRFALTAAELPSRITRGDKARIRFGLKNTGFAPAGVNCKLSLVMTSGGKTVELALPQNPGDILPGEGEEIEASVPIPADMAGKTLRLGFKIVMSGGSGDKNGYDSIALANTETEYSGGVNYFCEYIVAGNKLVLNYGR